MDLPSDLAALREERPRHYIEAALLLVLCLTPILLYLPFLHMPFERDEGVYATVAQGLLHGKVPYRDLFDNKPPLVYAWYAISFSLFGESVVAPRLVAAVFLSLTAVALYQQARLVMPKTAAWIGAFLFALSTGLPWVALHANTEAYMLLPLVSSLMFFTIGLKRGGNRWFFLAGLLAGFAIMTKQVAVWNLLALAGISVFYNRKAGGTLWRSLAPTGWLLAGSLLSLSAVALPFAMSGALNDFLYANLSYNWMYMGFLTAAQRLANLGYGMLFFCVIAAPFVAGALAGLVIIWRRRASAADYILILWAFASAVGVASGGRFFPHYFLQLMPALAVLTGVVVYERFGRGHGVRLSKPAWMAGGLLIVLSVGFTAILYLVPTQAEEQVVSSIYYQKEWEASSLALGHYIKERTGPEDTIFNYGRESQVYFYADRQPAIPYFYDWVLQYDAVPMATVISELETAKPVYVVDSLQAPIFDDWAAAHPSEWRRFLGDNYYYMGRVYFADVYVLKGYVPPADAGASD
ncbi:MAG TPA: glycosyltransferase family 39 protein [Dehalococcoidia bacterium]|nr:glycosyltransferase family 39 protein [Dehalococcoidia bacterium]